MRPKCLGQQFHNKDELYCPYCEENGKYACEWDRLYEYIKGADGKRNLERVHNDN